MTLLTSTRQDSWSKVSSKIKGLVILAPFTCDKNNVHMRMLIAIAALYNLEIHQMAVKTTFLNDDLDEEIYIEQPEGFKVPRKTHKSL